MIFQFLGLPLIFQIGIGVGLLLLSYLLMPKPKTPKPEFRDLEYPTADAGRPIVVVFGTDWVKAPNVLNYAHKNVDSYEVSA